MNIVVINGLNAKLEKQTILVPKDARILSVFVQQEHIYVAVEQDANAAFDSGYGWQTVEFAVFKSSRRFCVDGYHFLGTVILDFGNSIYHVFYRNV